MHGNDGSLVGVKVDETIAGGLTGELVRHHLEVGMKSEKEGVLQIIPRASKMKVFESSP